MKNMKLIIIMIMNSFISGDLFARQFLGILIVKEDGFSQITDGCGSRITVGAGLHIITEDGTSAIFTDGYGCREMPGLVTG